MKKWEKLYERWYRFPAGALRLKALASALAMFLTLVFSGAAAAQNWSDFEYEPGEGLHEEEWYDPSDWFDTGAGISFESDDWWDYGYGYGYDYGYGDDWGYDEYYGVSPTFTDEPYGTDEIMEYDGFYTDRWYEDDGVFDGWFD